MRTFERSRLGLGYVPEDRRIFPELTVRENLATAVKPETDGTPWTLDRVFDLFPALGEMQKRAGGLLSGGEQQMLSIARTLMGNPRLLLLDEPSEGLAPLVIRLLRTQILRLKDEGMARWERRNPDPRRGARTPTPTPVSYDYDVLSTAIGVPAGAIEALLSDPSPDNISAFDATVLGASSGTAQRIIDAATPQ